MKAEIKGVNFVENKMNLVRDEIREKVWGEER